MDKGKELECYRLHLKDFTEQQISKKLKIGQSSVSRAISKVIQSREYKLGVQTVVTFMHELEKLEEFWKEQTREYQDLIEIIKKMKRDEDVPELDKIDAIRKLMESQSKAKENIAGKAVQGQFLLALRDIKRQLADKS